MTSLYITHHILINGILVAFVDWQSFCYFVWACKSVPGKFEIQKSFLVKRNCQILGEDINQTEQEMIKFIQQEMFANCNVEIKKVIL